MAGAGPVAHPRDRVTIVKRPISIREAKAYVARWHRHLKPPTGALFALSAYRLGAVEPCGVIIVGRPLAEARQDGVTCEVLRCAVPEGERNAASFLYGKAKRAAQALGYLRCVTSSLATESGDTLRAVGAQLDRTDKGREWSSPGRPRAKGLAAQSVMKHRWTLFDDRESPTPEREP